jgi:hypothetical protein
MGKCCVNAAGKSIPTGICRINRIKAKPLKPGLS